MAQIFRSTLMSVVILMSWAISTAISAPLTNIVLPPDTLNINVPEIPSLNPDLSDLIKQCGINVINVEDVAKNILKKNCEP